MKITLVVVSVCMFLIATSVATAQKKTDQDQGVESGSQQFWNSLKKLSGKAYAGEVVNAPEGDETFSGKKLVMYARPYEADLVQIHFFVGDDRSRTWVISKTKDRITLKHDHRHEDGKPDEVTNYGGSASNSGSATSQVFPADQETVDLLPAAAANVWWINVEPGQHYTYNLRRLGTDRFFTVKFDLSKEIPKPPSAWGWED